jgi:hypothetical protein
MCPLTHTKRVKRYLATKKMMDILEPKLVIGLIHEVKKKKEKNITFKLSTRR